MPCRSPQYILVTEVTVTVETILFIIIIGLGVCCSLNRLFMKWPGNLMKESALSARSWIRIPDNHLGRTGACLNLRQVRSAYVYWGKGPTDVLWGMRCEQELRTHRLNLSVFLSLI